MRASVLTEKVAGTQPADLVFQNASPTWDDKFCLFNVPCLSVFNAMGGPVIFRALVVEKSPQQVKCQPKLFYGSDGYTSGGHSLWYSVLLGLSSLVLMKLATR